MLFCTVLYASNEEEEEEGEEEENMMKKLKVEYVRRIWWESNELKEWAKRQ